MMTYWKQIAIGAFIAIIYGVGYYKGYSQEKAAYDAYKSQIEAESKQNEIHNAEVVAKQKKVTDDLAKGYSDAVTKLNDYYRNHPVWMPRGCDSQAVSKVSDTATALNGEAKGYPASATGVDPLDCASDVLQLLYLQKWVKEQSNID